MSTIRIHRIAAIALIAATLGISRASHAADQTPKPSPEIQRMTVLAGSFQGEASYTPAGAQPIRFTLHHTNKVIAGGFGLACHEESDSPELGHYEAENLIGWDEGGRKIHLFSVTTDPNTHDHAGAWTSPSKVTMRYEGLKDGKKYVEVIPMEIVSANQYRFKATTSVAGKVTGVFEADMKRVESMSSR
jgi:hypothetical protein